MSPTKSANGSQTPSIPETRFEEEMILPLCAVFRRYLKQEGLKFTPERAKILDAVLAKEGVFEADELTFELRNIGHRVSKATVYRTLKHLLEARIIREVLIDSKLSHYRLCSGREPKAHLVCLETNEIIEFDAPELAELRDRIAKERGFEPVTYQFVVYGLSPEAQQEAAKDKDDDDEEDE